MSAAEYQAAVREFSERPPRPGGSWCAPLKPDGPAALAEVRTFSDISPEPLRWLWPGRFPLGKLSLLCGDPGLGKSLATVDIAARASTGTRFPDGATCEQGNVVFLSAEDDPADTIRPRLDAAGADVSRVHLLEAVRRFAADGKSLVANFSLESDIPVLEELVKRTGARLVIVDPISAYLGGVDSHTNADVRGLLAPLAALAAKHRVAVVAITHLRKSAGAAIYRAMGSLAFAAAARAVWGVVADPDDNARRLFLPVKQNLALDGGGLAYRIEAPQGIARIAWELGAVTVDVNRLMSGALESREDHSEWYEAEKWLRDFLSDGPAAAAEVLRESRSAGLSRTTVWRAAQSLRVVKRKLGGRGAGWEWSLQNSSGKDFKESNPTYTDVDSLNNELKIQADSSAKISKNPSMECIEGVDSLSLQEDAAEV